MSLTTRDFYRFDQFELQPARRLLTRNGERIAISPKTFEVLLCLIQHAGEVVLKDELLKAVWPDSFVEEGNLTQHIFWLRKALTDHAACIVTVPGRGYECTARIEAVSAPPARSDSVVDVVSPDASPSDSLATEIHLHRSTETTRVIIEETAVSTSRNATAPQTRLVQRRWTATLAAGILLALAGWGVWHWRHRVVPGDHHKVVLADFVNTTGNPAFDRTLDTLLATEVKQSPYLLVASGG
jgi:eukaryotic-like serine/threonine-protein kinase